MASTMTTASLIQSAKDLSISSTDLPSPTSSSTLLPSNSPESTPMALQKPRKKKKPFKPSKRQQMREKATTRTPAEPICSQSHPSVYIPDSQDYLFNANAWSDLSSELWKSNRAKELTLEWDEAIGEEQLVKIAKQVVDDTEAWFMDDENDDTARTFRMLNLVSSMRLFVKHCRLHLTNVRSFKIKLSALHGKCATRCPLWHADNVPVRWIQTYTGPGCHFLDEEKQQRGFKAGFNPFLQRVRESDHDRESRKLGSEWKRTLVDMSGVPVSQSPTGEPAVLVGRRWHVWSIEQQGSAEPSLRGPMGGVLHRSPQNVPADQGRILLNLDVVCRHEDFGGEDHHDHSKCGGSCGHAKTPDSATKKPTSEANKKIQTPLADSWIQRRKDKKNGNVKAGGKNCRCGPKMKCPC